VIYREQNTVKQILSAKQVDHKGDNVSVKQYKIYTFTIVLVTILLVTVNKFAVLQYDVIKCNSLACHKHILQDVKIALVWLSVQSL